MPRNAALSLRELPGEPDHCYAVIIDATARRYAELTSDAQRVLRLCDGVRSLDQILIDSPLAPPATARVMKELLALGVVAAMAPTSRRRQLPTTVTNWLRGWGEKEKSSKNEVFSEDEEAFFASPVRSEPTWSEDDNRAIAAMALI